MAAALEKTLRWPAPAKINLFLHVTGRRPDGYHTLQTVFQFLDLCDWLDFERREDGRIVRTTAVDGIPPEQDLIVRAARALQAQSGAKCGASLNIDKHLPVGGGIGGGSSDAATTLVALNILWGLGLSSQDLARIGLHLGADVPVFIAGEASFAEGVGEVLTAVAPAEPWYVLLKPDCAVPTAAVFADPDLTRDTPPITIRDFLQGAGRNDCEPVVRRRFPAVNAALDWLSARAPSRLTGTGACVYAICAGEAQATSIVAEVPSPWQAYAVRGLNRSPLLDRLARARGAGGASAKFARDESID
ncbi:MAG: 4-diphosphocytidyl-2-C-methyl-D-erythritol kinase [Gammaproteobacteria bacterium]|nr:4-diphosphocytidyl-2-C-methyl-D-erythritol kinase [Gammaproteobacteria bacterium]